MQCILDKLKCTWVRLEQSFWSYLSSQKKWGTFNGEKVLARFRKLLCIVWMHLFDSSIHCSKVNEIYCLNKSLWGLDIQNLCVRRLIACSVNIIPFSNISATWYYSILGKDWSCDVPPHQLPHVNACLLRVSLCSVLLRSAVCKYEYAYSLMNY